MNVALPLLVCFVITADAFAGATPLPCDPSGQLQLEVRTLDGVSYGARMIPVPRARANTVLEEIQLARGSTIVAEIRQTEPGQVVAADLLRLRNEGRAPAGVTQTVTLGERDGLNRTVRFENVEPGQYVVMARGAEPSQRAGERVAAFERDTPPVHVQLAPFLLRFRAQSEGEPLRKGRVILRQHDALWEVRVPIGAEGEAEVELWQPGRFTATLDSFGGVPFRNRRTLTEAIDTEWLLEVPRFEVVGTVIDAKTGAPVANASLALDMHSPEHAQLAVSVDAGADGTFRFAPVFPGEHKLQAAAPDYPVTQMTYVFSDDEETRNVTIALERQPKTNLTVIDARGNPVLGAGVYVFRGATSVAFTKTGGDGMTPLFIPDGETRTVYVVPRDGSLGAAQIASGTAEVRLSLPDGTCRIIVRTESESHEPIAGIMLDVSYNGLRVLDEVIEALVGRGARITSGTDGRVILDHMPPGVYELRAVETSLGIRVGAPLRMIAAPGENVVVMTFAHQ